MNTVGVNTPSSGASRHLLPIGEKKPAAMVAPSSPHRGEGGSPIEPGVGALIIIAAESEKDVAQRENLLDRAMGKNRKRKSSEKLRRGRMPSEGLSFVVRDAAGTLVATVRLWDVTAGENGPRALLLGPLAVDPSLKGAGIGSALMRHAIAEAGRLGHKAILLVGDAPYYARFGFSAEKTGKLAMPGPYERERFLALELEDNALDGAKGVLKASGRKIPAAPTSLAA